MISIVDKKGRGKRAQSEVITTVLIILLVLAAVFIVWQAVKGLIKSSTNKVGTDKFNVQLATYSANPPATGNITVPIQRGSGEGELTGVKIVFKSASGDTTTITNRSASCLPPELERRNCVIDRTLLGGLIPVSWEVYPIVKSTSGEDVGLKASESSSLAGTGGTTPGPACPDGTCNGGETCLTCPSDCGACPDTDGDGIINLIDPCPSTAINDSMAIFDGVNDYVSVPDFAFNAITIAAWVKDSSMVNGVYTNLVGKEGSFVDILYRTSSKTQQQYWDYDVADSQYKSSNTGGEIVENNWYFLTMVYDGTTVTHYLNAVFNQTFGGPGFNMPIVDNSNDFVIGKRLDNVKNKVFAAINLSYFPGTIDDVAIYNAALSQAQVTQLYNSGNHANSICGIIAPTACIDFRTTTTSGTLNGVTYSCLAS